MKGDMEVEVLYDSTDRDAARKAKRRMDLCVQPSQESLIAGYNPNEASRNDSNGFPDDTYGSGD